MIMTAWWSAKPRQVQRAVVDVERIAKYLSPATAEHAPRSDHVGGWIADSDTAEVDDRSEPATFEEHVGPQQVGVYPHRIHFPGWSFERLVPRGGGRIAVYDAPRRLDRPARDGVEFV